MDTAIRLITGIIRNKLVRWKPTDRHAKHRYSTLRDPISTHLKRVCLEVDEPYGVSLHQTGSTAVICLK